MGKTYRAYSGFIALICTHLCTGVCICMCSYEVLRHTHVYLTTIPMKMLFHRFRDPLWCPLLPLPSPSPSLIPNSYKLTVCLFFFIILSF